MLLRRSLLGLAVVLMATVALPVQGGGCGGKTVCFKAKGGTCASAAQAGAFFVDSCLSVDGEPTFNGGYCCYPVTEAPSGPDPDFVCGDGGFGGVGGGGIGGAGGSGGGSPGRTCAECACTYPVSQGGCADLCDEKLNGTTTPNFCNSASALAQCAACIMTTCGEDPLPSSCN